MHSEGYIYTCREAEFTIGGTRYDVSGFDVRLGISAIPEVVLRIAPEKSEEGSVHIRKMSLSSLNGALGDVMHSAEKLTECDFRFVLEKHDAMTGKVVLKNEIDLKKWLLSSVGLEDVTSSSVFYMSVTIKHPIYRLALVGGFWLNLVTKAGVFGGGVQGSTNILEAGIAGYETLSGKLDFGKMTLPSLDAGIPPSSLSPNEIMEKVAERFKDVPKIIRDTMRWDPSLGGGKWGFPFADVITGKPSLVAAMKELVAESWVHSFGAEDRSVWDGMLGAFSSLGVAIYPYFWEDKLPVAPRFPWTPVDFDIDESNVSTVTLPGNDPCPIFGVCGTPETLGGNGFTMMTAMAESQEQEDMLGQASSYAFVPKGDYDANGKFISVPVPSWVGELVSRAAGYERQGFKTGMNDGDGDGDGELPAEQAKAGINSFLKIYNTCCMLYFSSVFALSYKEFVEARMNCAFMPKVPTGSDEGDVGSDWVVPTKVFAFKAGGETLFEGYITSVTHSISVVNSTATTSISAAYCRPAGGYDVISGGGDGEDRKIVGYKGAHPMYNVTPR